MKSKWVFMVLLLVQAIAAKGQTKLSLEDCRAMALENNQQLKISKLTADIAENVEKAAKTKYLPKVSAVAGYQHLTKEISLLSDKQKDNLSHLGSNTLGNIGGQIGQNISGLAQQGLISPEIAQQLGRVLGNIMTPLAQIGDNIGETLRDALRTNTRNVYAGSIMVTQPIYTGGAIKAANNMAAIGRNVAENDIALKRQVVLYAVDNAYWLIVLLKKKEGLATQYKDLMQQLNDNVQKMYKEGVATKADGLKVEVMLNAANLQLAELDNGISLAKMALYELCGLPLNSNIELLDEKAEMLSAPKEVDYTVTDTTFNGRPEVRLLQNAVDMNKEKAKLVTALYRPHIALTAGYSVMNPNSFNGFQQKFSGVWNIGILLQVPIWSWGEGKYRLNAAKAATTISEMQLSDVRNKIKLEVEQHRFRLDNANKQLSTARKNMAAADENLRCANVGFKEGVMTVTEVMAAQTAWQAAKTAIIDAEIAVRMAQIGLNKAIGQL